MWYIYAMEFDSLCIFICTLNFEFVFFQGQFNYVNIIVCPLDHNSNTVTVQTKEGKYFRNIMSVPLAKYELTARFSFSSSRSFVSNPKCKSDMK